MFCNFYMSVIRDSESHKWNATQKESSYLPGTAWF